IPLIVRLVHQHIVQHQLIAETTHNGLVSTIQIPTAIGGFYIGPKSDRRLGIETGSGHAVSTSNDLVGYAPIYQVVVPQLLVIGALFLQTLVLRRRVVQRAALGHQIKPGSFVDSLGRSVSIQPSLNATILDSLLILFDLVFERGLTGKVDCLQHQASRLVDYEKVAGPVGQVGLHVQPCGTSVQKLVHVLNEQIGLDALGCVFAVTRGVCAPRRRRPAHGARSLLGLAPLLHMVERDMAGRPADRSVPVRRERQRQHGWIERVAEQVGPLIAKTIECVRNGGQSGGFAVEHDQSMDQIEQNGAYLHQLELAREQFIGDKVVLDVFVVVFEQVDANERVVGRRSDRHHARLPVGLAEARLARDQPLGEDRWRVQCAQNGLKLDGILEQVGVHAAHFGPALQKRVHIEADLFHLELEQVVVRVVYLVSLVLVRTQLLVQTALQIDSGRGGRHLPAVLSRQCQQFFELGLLLEGARGVQQPGQLVDKVAVALQIVVYVAKGVLDQADQIWPVWLTWRAEPFARLVHGHKIDYFVQDLLQVGLFDVRLAAVAFE
ncbi:hypothetical protein BpHYR1_024859, partial [Brachionus plicatilis]